MDPAILFVSFKSASKIRLVRWPALLETRASRLPTTRYAGQPIAIGSQAACQLHAPQIVNTSFIMLQQEMMDMAENWATFIFAISLLSVD